MEIQSIAVGVPPPSAQVIQGTGNGFTQTMAETAEGRPDVVTTWISPFIALIARFGAVFFLALGGQLGGDKVGLIASQTWMDAVLAALCTAGVALIWSLATIFGNLEKKYPIVSQLT